MVQEKVKFDRAFGPAELRPIKHFQTQIDGTGIHADQFVLKPKLPLADFDLNPAPVKEFDKDMLIQLPGAVPVGIGQSGMARSCNTQMSQLPLAASKASGNLSQGMGPTQLAEEHRYKLIPTRKPFGMAFCLRDRYQLLELQSRKQLQQLTKYATKSIHKWPSFICEIGFADSI
jgi:hypothetical protein